MRYGMGRGRVAVVIAFASIGTLLNCGGGNNDDPPRPPFDATDGAVTTGSNRVCAPGSTQSCVCPSATGAQICARDGLSWEPCTCAAGEAGSDASLVTDAKPADASDADSDSSADSGAPTANVGSVDILCSSFTTVDGLSPSYTVHAAFYPQLAPTACVFTDYPPCGLVVCGAPPASDGGAPVLASAGTLTIMGGASTLKLDPQTGGPFDGQYLVGASSLYFNGGESITVSSAAGSQVPSFTTAATAPSRIVMYQPTPPGGGGSATINRSLPFSFAWTGPSAGTVNVSFDIGDPLAPPYSSLRCSFPASAGGGVVPANVMQKLPAGAGSIGATTLSASKVTSGAWTINLTLGFSIVDQGGYQFGFPVQLN